MLKNLEDLRPLVSKTHWKILQELSKAREQGCKVTPLDLADSVGVGDISGLAECRLNNLRVQISLLRGRLVGTGFCIPKSVSGRKLVGIDSGSYSIIFPEDVTPLTEGVEAHYD